MKLKLSPFTILFLSLNSLLIFCATSNIDAGKEQSTRLTDTKMETQADSDFNFDGYTNKNTNILGKPSHGFGYKINGKSAEDLKVVSVKDDYTKESLELKTEYLYFTMTDTVLIEREGISLPISDKIGTTVSYSK